MNKIIWIIDGWRYWDTTNGNSYHLTRLTHAGTGKSVIFDHCEGNVRHYLKNDYGRIHTAPIQEIKYREWRRMLKMEYYTPAAVYVHGRNGCENITRKVINQLRNK